MPDGSQQNLSLKIGETIQNIKQLLEDQYNIPTNSVTLSLDGVGPMIDPLSLNDFPTIMAEKKAVIRVQQTLVRLLSLFAIHLSRIQNSHKNSRLKLISQMMLSIPILSLTRVGIKLLQGRQQVRHVETLFFAMLILEKFGKAVMRTPGFLDLTNGAQNLIRTLGHGSSQICVGYKKNMNVIKQLFLLKHKVLNKKQTI